ncbi:redox-sensing transcriptional repressor Rex [Anaerolineales bacterium]
MPTKVSNNIPDIVIGRLPLYLRALIRLKQDGYEFTSSHELGRRLGISSAQIRKDLSHFGGFGKQGTGYQIDYLIDKLRQVLHLNQEWKVIVVGAGDLGTAISHYKGFNHRGFEIVYVFDASSNKVGKQLGNLIVKSTTDMPAIIKAEKIRIAMLAVPAESAQEVADLLIESGIQAILNYAPINIKVPQHVQVQYIDPVIHLQHMTYYVDDK